MYIKECTKCKKTKVITEFTKNNKHKSGVHSWCKECTQAASRAYNKTDAGRRATSQSKLKHKYGMTLDDYDVLLESQGNACAICGTKETGTYGRFNVDHNHATGEVRGLLCQGCNSGLGHFKDNPTTIANGLKYLVERGHYG